jgi:hypothetical protein
MRSMAEVSVKRYEVDVSHGDAGSVPDAYEDAHGEWLRYEDLEPALVALIAAAKQCADDYDEVVDGEYGIGDGRTETDSARRVREAVRAFGGLTVGG